MNAMNGDPENDLCFRLGRLAGCLEHLLLPDLPDGHVNGLIYRVLGTADRLYSSELLPLTGFRTEGEANATWEQLAIELDERGIGPGNVRTDVDSIFEELALNAVQHSQSSKSCYGVVWVADIPQISSRQHTGGEILYIVGISDSGIGIPNSLRKNPLYDGLADDKDAILRATEMDVTGTDSQRGAGLHHVMERTRAYRGELLIISDRGFMRVSGGANPTADNLGEDGSVRHCGTVVVTALPVPALETP